MKNAIMFHGSGETPNSFWYPSIRKFLENHGYKVWAPQLPEPQQDTPEIKIQLPFVLENGSFDEETLLIGHSAGCPLILSTLENISVKINKAILVAGFSRHLNHPSPILQEKYLWDKIKQNVKDIIFINSDDDPYNCNDKEGQYMFQHLGGTLIVRHGEGHFGSNTFKQPYKEFPLLEKLLIDNR